jgi:queuosine precursor transporter
MNEIYVLGVAIMDFTAILLAYFLGRKYVRTLVIVNLVLVAVFAREMIDVFGYTTNLPNIYYSGVVLSMMILCERFGEVSSRSSILMGFLALATFAMLSQAGLAIGISGGPFEEILEYSPRNAAASFIAYLVSMFFLIGFWSTIPMDLLGKGLVSIVLVQFIDSILFFTLAFSGVLPPMQVLQAMTIGFLLKVALGVISLPFLYICTKIPTRDKSTFDY